MIFDWNWVVCTISVVVANLSCLALCSFLFSILPSKRNLLTHLETVLVLAMTAFVNGLVSGLLSYQFQGSIDFKTANIHRTVGMYFLVFTGNIEWYDLQGQYHLIHLLLPGECIGKYFPRDSISGADIRHTCSWNCKCHPYPGHTSHWYCYWMRKLVWYRVTHLTIGWENNDDFFPGWPAVIPPLVTHSSLLRCLLKWSILKIY